MIRFARSAGAAATLLALSAALPRTAEAQLTNPSCSSPLINNLVQNCSFEAPGTGSGNWQWTTKITGWASSSGHFERWYGHDNFTSRDGRAHLELDVDTDRNAGGVMNTTIWQVIQTQVGVTYDIFFSVAHRRTGDAQAFSQVGVMLDPTGSNTPTFGDPLATTAPIFNANHYQWRDYTFSFTATGANTTIGFRALGTPNEYGDHLDNIGVVARSLPGVVVPEPTTFALLGAGLAGLGVVARRRRQR